LLAGKHKASFQKKIMISSLRLEKSEIPSTVSEHIAPFAHVFSEILHIRAERREKRRELSQHEASGH